MSIQVGRKVLVFFFSHVFNYFSLFKILDWEVASKGTVHGLTHQSQTNNQSNNFSHTFTIDISKSVESEESSSPLLLFEVFEVGLFNRQKAVGYGFTHLPEIPGLHLQTVSTWRPYVKGVSQNLENHFLSLRPQIENLSYPGRPNRDPILGRFPFTTETSGNVELQIETMVQREKTNSHNIQQSSLRCSKKSLAADEIVKIYQKAKQRLEATQKALLN